MLATSGGTVNHSVYRLPYAASDGQQFLETTTSTVSGSVYQDVPGLTVLAGRPVRFGGKIRGPVGATGSVAVFEFDAGSNLLGSFQLPFTASGGAWTGAWQAVDFSGPGKWSPQVASVRLQMYLDVIGANYDFDEMYLDAP